MARVKAIDVYLRERIGKGNAWIPLGDKGIHCKSTERSREKKYEQIGIRLLWQSVLDIKRKKIFSSDCSNVLQRIRKNDPSFQAKISFGEIEKILYKANREKSSFDSVFKFYSPPPPPAPERVLRIRRGKYIEWKDGILQLWDGRCLLSRISRKYLIYINAAFIFEILIIVAWTSTRLKARRWIRRIKRKKSKTKR